MHHNHKAGVSSEAHAILIQSVTLFVHWIFERIRSDLEAPEAGPIGHPHENNEPLLNMLDKNVSDHGIVLAQLVAERALIITILHLVLLQLGPQVEAILS